MMATVINVLWHTMHWMENATQIKLYHLQFYARQIIFWWVKFVWKELPQLQ